MRAASIRHRPACIAVPDPVRLLTQAAIEKPPFANPPKPGHARGQRTIPKAVLRLCLASENC
jgi:hypothetical protein